MVPYAYMEQITNQVHTYRTRLGLTQEQLAQAVNVTRQTIISIEKGNYTPSGLLALKFAEFFNVSVEAIFSIEHA